MRINAKEPLFGHPALKVREVLRRGEFGISVALIGEVVGVDDGAAAALLSALDAAGYIERSPHTASDDTEWWRATVKGHALAMASAAPALRRKAADKLLLEFLSRVEQVRDDGRFLFKVESAVLFGSFLSDATEFGDIDLGVAFRPAFSDRDEQDAAEDRCRDDAEAGGRRFPDFIGRLYWPELEVRRFLRARRPISLHDPRRDASIIAAGPHVTSYAQEQVVRGAIPLLKDWPSR